MKTNQDPKIQDLAEKHARRHQEALQDEIDERHEEFQGYLSDDGSADYSDDGWRLRDEGRNDDGSGLSYGERNA